MAKTKTQERRDAGKTAHLQLNCNLPIDEQVLDLIDELRATMPALDAKTALNNYLLTTLPAHIKNQHVQKAKAG
jgi:hypothetical protein